MGQYFREIILSVGLKGGRGDLHIKFSVLEYNFSYDFHRRESKGGYLEGSITFKGLGENERIDFIELDLVKDPNVNGVPEKNVHPNVLYVSDNARKEKNSKGGIKQVSIL